MSFLVFKDFISNNLETVSANRNRSILMEQTLIRFMFVIINNTNKSFMNPGYLVIWNSAMMHP